MAIANPSARTFAPVLGRRIITIVMAQAPQSSKLRTSLRKRDRTLGNRADEFWRRAFEIHERQTPPDATKAGWEHVIQVENNIQRLLADSPQARRFTPYELFLLSCAACSHDFDKGLKTARPGGPHGAASGRFVYEQRGKLGVDAAEAIAIDYIDSIHDLRGTALADSLERLPDAHPVRAEAVDLRRLAVVLKVADTLHADQTRVSDLAVDVAKLTGRERSKHLGRAGISGWKVEGRKVILVAYPDSPEQRQAVQTAFEMLREDDWSPITRELRSYSLPHQIDLEIHDRYLTPAAKVSREAKGREPGAGRPPGMDHYQREEAPYFAGRDDDREKLEQLVYTYAACRLVGPSGVGKSSLLHAGLWPAVESLANWRFLITRPDKETGCFFSVEDFPGFGPAGAASFAEACTSGLGDAHHLVVVLDQFEDVAYFGQVDVDQVAAEIAAAQHAVRPGNLHLVFAYRDDVESLLGELWEHVTGSARGLPTHYLRRLSREGARDAMLRLLERAQLTLAPPDELLDRILDDLVTASQRESALTVEVVYPPFVQMVTDRLAEIAESGTVKLAAYEALAGKEGSPADVAIAEFLERSVEALDVKGIKEKTATDIVTAARALLTCLARSGGEKGAANAARVSAETGVGRRDVETLLHEMGARRLVRRLSSGRWEIIHDHLARRVIERWVSEEERRFKYVREALEARARTIEIHHGFLTPPEMRDLWLFRHRLPPHSLSDSERLVILASMFTRVGAGEWTAPMSARTLDRLGLGWFWVSDLAPTSLLDMLSRLARIEHPSSDKVPSDLLGRILESRELSVLRNAAKDPGSRIRRAAVEALGNIGTGDDLGLLREMAKDPDACVLRAAAEAMAKVGMRDDVAFLREMAKDADWLVRRAAAEAIGKLPTGEDVGLLREMVTDADWLVRLAAVEAIGKVGAGDDVALLWEMVKDIDEDVRDAALEAIGKVVTPDEVAFLRKMFNDVHAYVRKAAVETIGKVVTRDDVAFLRDMAKDVDNGVRGAAVEAMGKVLMDADIPFLRDMAKDPDWWVRSAALHVIGKVGSRKDVGFLREMANDVDWPVRRAALEAIGKLVTGEDVGFLREMAKDVEGPVRRAALEAIWKLATGEDVGFLREMAKDVEGPVCRAALEAIGKLATGEGVGFLREMAKEVEWEVRQAAAAALGKLGTGEDVGLLREMAKDGEWRVRQAAVEAIGKFLERGVVTEAVDCLHQSLLDKSAAVSSAAVDVVTRYEDREVMMRFLDAHQDQMVTAALVVFDWHLYAPAFLREAYERKEREERSGDNE